MPIQFIYPNLYTLCSFMAYNESFKHWSGFWLKKGLFIESHVPIRLSIMVWLRESRGRLWKHVSPCLPLHYWHEAFSIAVFLINQLPSQPIVNVSSYEKLFQVKPNYLFLRVFDCICFPNVRPYNTNKL